MDSVDLIKHAAYIWLICCPPGVNYYRFAVIVFSRADVEVMLQKPGWDFNRGLL